MMTTSGENEPKAIVKDSMVEWQESVAAARQARRERREPYTARHRRVRMDGTETQDITERTA